MFEELLLDQLSKINERMSSMESRMDDRMSSMENRMSSMENRINDSTLCLNKKNLIKIGKCSIILIGAVKLIIYSEKINNTGLMICHQE